MQREKESHQGDEVPRSEEAQGRAHPRARGNANRGIIRPIGIPEDNDHDTCLWGMRIQSVLY